MPNDNLYNSNNNKIINILISYQNKEMESNNLVTRISSYLMDAFRANDEALLNECKKSYPLVKNFVIEKTKTDDKNIFQYAELFGYYRAFLDYSNINKKNNYIDKVKIKSISKYTDDIIFYIYNNDYVQHKDLAKFLDIGPNQLTEIMKKIISEELVIKNIRSNYTYYSLTYQGVDYAKYQTENIYSSINTLIDILEKFRNVLNTDSYVNQLKTLKKKIKKFSTSNTQIEITLEYNLMEKYKNYYITNIYEDTQPHTLLFLCKPNEYNQDENCNYTNLESCFFEDRLDENTFTEKESCFFEDEYNINSENEFNNEFILEGWSR